MLESFKQKAAKNAKQTLFALFAPLSEAGV
jgi:hypothetical protein